MPTLDEALAEAYASASSDDVILHTIEIRHPTFDTPARMVCDFGELLDDGEPRIFGHMLTLEDDAPADAGESVMFIACMFEFALPTQQEGSLPEIDLSFDNVTQMVSDRLDAAVLERAPVEVTYREYLASDVTRPVSVLTGLTISRTKADASRVTAKASFPTLINSNYPGKLYRAHEFRGLTG